MMLERTWVRDIIRYADLVHQDIRSSVQSSSHRFIQDVFKPLLLPYDSVEEIGFIDM